MDCADVERLLSPLLDAELDPSDETRVRSHIAECGRCQGKWLLLQATRDQVVAAFEPESLSPEFDARLARRVARARSYSVPSRPWLWAAAAALLMAVLLLRPGTPRPI